ncbi:DUF499 domain-containing protein [Gordonia neofelifaecis]|uniref:Swt1-like HEPN domain-containing protein n=1 Tax=Gordonia neofelifaecis NRRL B-59395 TaxID=644548 RepID=F1YML0_9ACTN|nr:DUF499 domain-containing protein [Gordonia neofelifaecis]EGD53945.1 hypothetical protein SCNU_15779 [Gordonia neofelifaecis NRRL B-59395]
MAPSNRDRIHQAFELLGPAVDRFLTETLGPGLPPGASGWIDVLRAVRAPNAHPDKKYNPLDPSDSLRMFSDNIPYKYRRGWDPIGKRLSRAQMSWATQLVDARNRFAHHENFTNDDAQFDLDLCHRFLLAIGAPKEAAEVAKLRDDVRAIGTRQATERAARNAPALQVGSENLPAWRDVLTPHPDIQSDRFNAAEFAADLYTVAMSSGGHKSEYTDPGEFFGRTYLTEGLRDLITRNVARLTGDENASPVINLQTNFGGGKTHSMLALWHLASGADNHVFGDEVAPLAKPLADLNDGVRRVALVGNQLVPSRENSEGGRPNIRTLWGELAWQLGGQEAYDIIAESDRTSTNPGADLRELFELYSPAVILIDEWVAYARQLVDPPKPLPAGDFDTQFTFAQTLTEAARATKGIQVVISIPASSSTDGSDGDGDEVNDEEVGGEYGREALNALKHVIGRTADQWQPANAEESFEIVRRRIFSTPDAEASAKIANIAKTIVEFYRKYHAEFPSEVRDSQYEDRIKRCYPIHPELFDRLYQDWSTLDRFQRTRGVLQMMNRVVGTLWRSDNTSALILPGTVPLEDSDVVSEVTKYLEDQFKPIIHTDVAGPESVPFHLDKNNEHLGKRKVAQRLSRAVFMAATPGLHSAHKGAEKQRVFLGTALPGDVPGNFHSALDALSSQSTYLYTESSRYWYDTQANITRTARDHAAGLASADVWAEVERRLTELRKTSPGKAFAGIHVFPESSADVPDETDTRLVVVPMEHTYAARSSAPTAMPWAKDVLEHRGTAIRSFKNSLVFLAADQNRARELDDAVRNYLAWKHVADNADDYGLGGQQTKQAADRRAASDDIVASRLNETFCWALCPNQQPGEATYSIDVVNVAGSKNDVYTRAGDKLGSDHIALARSSSLIQLDLTERLPAAWASGHLEVGTLHRYYATYPYLARLRDRDVLIDGLYSVLDDQISWRQQGFAFADAYDEKTERYVGLHLPSDDATLHLSDSTLIVKPGPADAQREKEIAEQRDREGAQAGEGGESGESGGMTAGTDAGQSEGGAATTRPVPRDAPKRRYFGSARLDADFPARDFGIIQQEILKHLSSTAGRVEIRIEISADNPDGFDDSARRTVSENATTLGFEQSGFDVD